MGKTVGTKPSLGSGHFRSRAGTLALVGGELAFDFANTTSGRGGPRHLEQLRTADDIAVWAHHAKIIGKKSARDLQGRFGDSPWLAERLRRRALELRDVIYGIGMAFAARKPAPSEDVDRMARIHAECVRVGRLKKIKGVYGWTWNVIDYPVEAILGPIALSALSLVCQADLSRIKQCPGQDCGWLFFDTTKNKNRRWCEMEVCGNRAKQKRLRRRIISR
jgi:predicted RNA-binding Zn ribbon-like protein